MKNFVSKFGSRVSALALAVFVLGCALFGFALPSKAVSYDGTPYYTGIHFDTYTAGSGVSSVTSAWNGNIFPSDTAEFELSDQYYVYQENMSDIGWLEYRGNPVFTLNAYWQTIDANSLPDFAIYFGFGGVDIYRTQVSFNLVSVRTSIDGVYYVHYDTISLDMYNATEQPLQIGSRMLDEIRYYSEDEWVTLQNLKITFMPMYIDDPDADPLIDFYFPLRTLSPDALVPGWFNDLDLTFEVIERPIEGDDFLGWIIAWADGFLGTPIIGQFSIGGLLAVVISVSLCVLLAKVLG